MSPHNVLLLSTYDLGHQPFGLASPAAWLKSDGATVRCLDLSVQPLNEEVVRQARLIAIYLPMHTATRLAVKIIPRLQEINPHAHLCCFGLYAPVNEDYLRRLGVLTILGGEYESGLLHLYRRIASSTEQEVAGKQLEPAIILERQQFLIPDRSGLPSIRDYAQLLLPNGSHRQAGYTVTSRGCKHRCRHCPIVPIYNSRFRIVQPDVVMADIRQQVAAGATHITFGDPDFFNGPGHTIPIVEALRAEFPDLTYDVTIKVEHLLKYNDLLPILSDTGCLFVTSAVEAVDDRILQRLQKGHTCAGFIQAAGQMRELGLTLNPTFVAFTPWTAPGNYLDMLATISSLGLIENVSPVQYAIRLLIPAGSLLMDLPEVKKLVGPYDQRTLAHPWQHPDPRMDQLYERVFHLVLHSQRNNESRITLFERVRQALLEVTPELAVTYPKDNIWDLASRPVPRLSESWY